MARLNGPPAPGTDGRPPSEDRGQLLIATGFAIAVVLVLLSVVLTTATFTENLATQRTDFVDQRVARFETDVHRGSSGLVVELNHDAPASHAELSADLHDGIENWSDLSGRFAAVDGAGTDVALVSTVDGTRIHQDTPTRNFTNSSGVGNWTLVNSVDRVRRYRMNVSRASLANPANGSCATADCFTVFVTDNSSTWTVAMRGNNTSVIVAVDGPVSSGTCVADGDWVTVNFTAGSVGGTECDALSFAEGLSSPYDEIRHESGSLAEGTYELTVSGPAMTIDSSNYNVSGSPRTSPAIYSATVAIAYRTAELTYETTTRVAPGEPDD